MIRRLYGARWYFYGVPSLLSPYGARNDSHEDAWIIIRGIVIVAISCYVGIRVKAGIYNLKPVRAAVNRNRLARLLRYREFAIARLTRHACRLRRRIEFRLENNRLITG